MDEISAIKKGRDLMQQSMMKMLYWSLYALLFLVLLTYSNPLHEYIFSNKSMFLFWLFLHLCAYATRHFAQRNPGYIDVMQKEEDSTQLKTIEVTQINESGKEKPDPRKCNICNITKPLRARHCNTCQRCVRKYDHHCFWIGSCIGEKNQKLFWTYLFFQLLSVVWDFSLCISGYNIAVMNNDMQSKGCWIVVIGICFLCSLFGAILLYMHTSYIVTNWTTWEKYRRKKIWYLKDWRGEKSPFDVGVLGNIKSVFGRNIDGKDWTIIGMNEEIKIKEAISVPEEEFSICC